MTELREHERSSVSEEKRRPSSVITPRYATVYGLHACIVRIDSRPPMSAERSLRNHDVRLVLGEGKL